MEKDRFPTKTVVHPSGFSDGVRGARMGFSEEYWTIEKMQIEDHKFSKK